MYKKIIVALLVFTAFAWSAAPAQSHPTTFVVGYENELVKPYLENWVEYGLDPDVGVVVWYTQYYRSNYDNLFRNSEIVVVEGEHVRTMFSKRELESWADGKRAWVSLDYASTPPLPLELTLPLNIIENFNLEEWQRQAYENYGRALPLPLCLPFSYDNYVKRIEEYVGYCDKAYVYLKALYGTEPTDRPPREKQAMLLTVLLDGGGFAGNPIEVGFPSYAYSIYSTNPPLYQPDGWVTLQDDLQTHFHELGHVFHDGGNDNLSEPWAGFGETYVTMKLGENSPEWENSGEFKKSWYMEELQAWENRTGNLRGGVYVGVMLYLGERFGWQIFSQLDTRYIDNGGEYDAMIALAYAFYPGIGDEGLDIFENRWRVPLDQDPDNDGFTTREEIKMRTNPLEAPYIPDMTPVGGEGEPSILSRIAPYLAGLLIATPAIIGVAIAVWDWRRKKRRGR